MSDWKSIFAKLLHRPTDYSELFFKSLSNLTHSNIEAELALKLIINLSLFFPRHNGENSMPFLDIIGSKYLHLHFNASGEPG